MTQTKNIHYNPPQLRERIINAPFSWNILARGTGKSEGILADKSVFLMESMPRSRGVMVGATFTQILTRTLPPIIAGWERLGYIQDVHYVIGKKPTDKFKRRFNWKGPYKPPLDFDYFISWWNGSGIQLVSQDRAGSANGLSIDWIIGDELKLINKERLEQELFPANRGIVLDYIHNPHHHGMTFTTDMPKGTAGRWILEKENLMDKQKVQAIVTLEIEIYNCYLQLNKTKSQGVIRLLTNKINRYKELANELRRNLVFFQEASTLENIHALGTDYFKDLMRNLPKFEFETAILNKRPYKLEDGFYPALDEDKHGYFSYDYHHTFESHGYDITNYTEDCRSDGDVIKGKPLHIAIDYNRRIWPIVTGQPIPGMNNECRILSGMHVLFPLGYADALNKWHNYYKYHDNHTVVFWYDHTALGEVEEPIKDKIVNHLKSLGWTVIEMYIGRTTAPEHRYNTIDDVLREEKLPWMIRINRDRCQKLLLSLFQTQAKETPKGFQKNKSTERDINFPADESTHYPDAFDTLVMGIIDSGLIVPNNDNTLDLIEFR